MKVIALGRMKIVKSVRWLGFPTVEFAESFIFHFTVTRVDHREFQRDHAFIAKSGAFFPFDLDAAEWDRAKQLCKVKPLAYFTGSRRSEPSEYETTKKTVCLRSPGFILSSLLGKTTASIIITRFKPPPTRQLFIAELMTLH